MRALLADPTFDYGAYSAASDQIARGHSGQYLTIGAHQIGSVTAVAFESASVPASYTALSSDEWDEQADGRLYRSVGWASTGSTTRYQITADLGIRAGREQRACPNDTLELAVNIWRYQGSRAASRIRLASTDRANRACRWANEAAKTGIDRGARHIDLYRSIAMPVPHRATSEDHLGEVGGDLTDDRHRIHPPVGYDRVRRE